ncbi:MAG: hypothetical protein LBH73_02000 [Spirochaetaceae bacterium]|jgi:hypothetical protein|nr:hypothetical protein [Spirochaetaceae bacterium]
MNDIEREVDQIQDKIYEKIKNMSPSEQTAYFNESGRKIAEQYGFTIVQTVQSEPVTVHNR